MRLHVDTWDPSYVPARDNGEAEPADPTAVTLDIERPADAWAPLTPPGTVRAPDVVLFLDGVRRIDGRLSVVEDDDTVNPGLAASYAAGVVRCDLRQGQATVVAKKVERHLFTASPTLADLTTPIARYQVRRTGSGDLGGIDAAVQADLRAVEEAVGTQARAEHLDDTDDLLIVDGPRHRASHQPRMLGYVKTHTKPYLPPVLASMVGRLRPGQRSPVFGINTGVVRHTWYLGLPTAPHAAPWAGIVRIEADGQLPTPEAVRLADRSAIALPRFASHPFKDARAPQNLVPIGGLERRLRAMLGDPRLLLRALATAAAAV